MPSLFDSSRLLNLASAPQYVALPAGSIKTPDDLASQSGIAFSPLTQGMALPTASGREVWVKFTVPATATPQTWFLRIPRQSLDMANFYSLNPNNQPAGWQVQSAGMELPASSWPMRTRDPVFELTTRADQSQQFFLKITHRNPVTEHIQLIYAADFGDGANRVGTLNGLMIGLFGALIMVSLIAAHLNQSRHFAWFALFVFTVLITQLTLSGYMMLRVWSHSAYMARIAGWLFPFLSLAALARFCISVSYAQELSAWIYRSLWAIIIMSILMIAAVALMPAEAPRGWINAVFAVGMLVIISCLSWIAWKSQTWLWAIVASLVPIILSAFGQIAYNFGLVRHVEFAQLGGAIAACFGLMIIYASLVLQTRRQLTSTVREDVIESKDMATGLFNERIAMARLPQVLLRSQRFERSCSVLMMRWVGFSDVMQVSSSTMRSKIFAHLGARLARAARDIDTVARVGDDLFLMLVEAPVGREMVNEITSKILAGCMRPSQYMPEQKGFDLHMAVWLSGEMGVTAVQVMEMLHTRIAQMRDGAQRRVQFVDSPLSTGSGKEPVDSQKHSEELLAKINSLEASHGLPTIALNKRKPAA